MSTSKAYRFDRDDVVRAIVAMDPKTELPAYMAVREEEITCTYRDLLGVLNDHKPVSIEHPLTLSKYSVPDRLVCGKREIKGDLREWRDGLLEECRRQRIMQLSAANKRVLVVFKEKNIRKAAALWFLYYRDKNDDEVFDSGMKGHAIGTLLGYSPEDIRAWYHAQLLQHVFMDTRGRQEWWHETKNKEEVELAKTMTRTFLASYKKWDADARQHLDKFLASKTVDDAVQTIRERMKPLVKAARA